MKQKQVMLTCFAASHLELNESINFDTYLVKIHLVPHKMMTVSYYSRTSVARTLMAHLPQLFRTRS